MSTLSSSPSYNFSKGFCALLGLALTVACASLHAQPTNVSAGRYHTCATTTGGALRCWGQNSPYGHLGDGTTTNRLESVQVVGLTGNIRQVSVGYTHSCAVTTAGAAKCWGNPSGALLGNLADNQTWSGVSQTSPVDVLGFTSGVASISAAQLHSCLLTSTGGVKCWGALDGGRLGFANQSIAYAHNPKDVPGLTSGISALATGVDHTCAVTDGGAVKCWGKNTYAQLGDGTTVDRTTPVTVPNLTNIRAVAGGQGHTCALDTSGGVKCWGWNGTGQIGDGTIGNIAIGLNALTPRNVVGLSTGVTSIAAGNSFTCAVTSAGGAKCWGANTFGQIGTGATTTVYSSPQDVKGLTSGVASITAGENYACARLVAGGVKCWGFNVFGALGDGTNVQRIEPVDAKGIASPGTTTATAPLDYSDMWWAGQSENGWGMAITQHGAPNHQQFNAFYVYAANGKPSWYVMPGGTWDASFTRFSGSIYQTDGSPQDAFNPANVRATAVGTGTLTFTSTSTATFSYTISGTTATKSITRQAFGVSDATPTLQVNDLWWGGDAQSGWGFSIAQQWRTLFGAWYTYDKSTCNASQSACSPTWYVMPGGSWGSGATANTYTGKLYSTVGSPWLGVTYNPSALQVTEVGTVSIAFNPDTAGASSGKSSTATMTYTFTAGPYAGVSRTVAISRQAF